MLDIHCASVKKQVHMGDTLGIFRVHQFEKVEQFCITCPNGNELWDMHEQMMRNSEVFYKMVWCFLSSRISRACLDPGYVETEGKWNGME